MVGRNFKFFLFAIFLIFSILFVINLTSNFVSAACWSRTDESSCIADTSFDCRWKNDSWGSWCEEVTCGSLWNQTDCTNTPVTGKNCSWSAGSTWSSCMTADCWSFSGTNESNCVNNSYNLNCNWRGECHTSSGGSPMGGIDCWSFSTQAECSNITGCEWGMCETKGCWSYADSASCAAGTDWKGKNCTWDGNYCTEKTCSRYLNESSCDAVTDLDGESDQDCIWKWGNCQEIMCWQWDYTNETDCVNNTANMSCSWDRSYCMEKGCWNYNSQSNCGEHSECYWQTSTSGGMCEEVNCWTWDSWKSGTKDSCENNSTLYGLSCIWQDMPGGTTEVDGWCYKDMASLNCTNFTTERQCMDTYYCWWEYVDWNTQSLGGTCKDPEWGGTGFGGGEIFNAWNPGCYIFDNNETNCNNTIGCNYTIDICYEAGLDPYVSAVEITANGINCTLLNDSSLCNSISVLGTCCSWQNNSCEENKMTTTCWDQMAATPGGEKKCGDASTSDACTVIAGDPWFMPCKWSNTTEKCKFNSEGVFGNTTTSLNKLDSEKSCEAAGGKWITENYCEGNRSAPYGRCEYKCDEETDCDAACFACEKYNSAGDIVNSSNAREACVGSSLGYCEFTADTNAPNSIGFCKARDQFKKGVATDCGADCGSCTYMGDKNNNDTTKTPTYYCTNSKANSVGGGCKWVTDNTTIQGGYCINKDELICEDACDRCLTQDKCITDGAKNRRNTTFENSSACEWDIANSMCTKSGQTSEICWDGLDNDGNGLVDCADSGCYADSFCGFVEGDCFGWGDNESCIAHDCDWVLDSWGAWCDFKGASCWKKDWNVTACEEDTSCGWHNDTYSGGTGACEQDWSLGESCMGLNSTVCEGAADTNNCTWSNDTWCNTYPSNETYWCQDFGGWCNYAPFAPKNCWLYDSNSTKCRESSGCNWSTGGWSEPQCEIDWSGNCWNYYAQDTCQSNGCWWKNESWGGSCMHNSSYCTSQYTQSECETENTYFSCYWNNMYGYCGASCQNETLRNSSTDCGATTGCIWQEENGWCSEVFTDQIACWNSSLSSNQEDCDATSGCRWKNPGWCDPVGFSGAGMAGAFGFTGGMGDSCWQYDGNKTMCESNSSVINMSCGWSSAYEPFCDVNKSSPCWGSYDNDSCINSGCYWFNGTDDDPSEVNNYCMNLADICWKNQTLKTNQGACNSNDYCNWTTRGTCEPSCFASERSNESDCLNLGGCRWITGWCNPAGTTQMFSGMQEGQHVQLGTDDCGEGIDTNDSTVDICSFGMKDMIDSYGFGVNVNNFQNASICNKEKLSSSLGGGFGAGNNTAKFYYYLDTDGNSTGSCTLSHNSSADGFEFRLVYESEWNDTLQKPQESFSAFKCKSNNWELSDIKLTAWPTKMCSEIGGALVAVEKGDLERFSTLYDSTKDIRVSVATANETTNMTSPEDTVSAGWMSPGAVDFKIEDMFSYGADAARFENILRKCYTTFEDCYNEIDDDDDRDIDCSDYDCKYVSKCNESGVNTANFTDTSTPMLLGAKVEEYTDSALILYDTTKPSNGTLFFYHNDSTCKELNASVYDVGFLKNNSIREFRTSHRAEIYNSTDYDSNSLNYPLDNSTTYYYKLKVCDEAGRCGQSKCSSFTTASADRCSYCDFVTRIQAPGGWDVNYDIDQDGAYEHVQGKVCGMNAGMKSNYSDGRRVNIKLNRTDASGIETSIEFYNATLTKTGLNSKIRNIDTGDAIKNGTTTDTGGNTIGYVGMISETRDKIVYNLLPERCVVKIPGVLNEIWHCDDNLTAGSCENRTAEANLTNYSDTSGYEWREWEIPFCEFSTWAGGKPSVTAASTTTSATSGGSGGSAKVEESWNKTYTISEEEFTEGVTKEIGVSERIKFQIGNDSHHVGIREITATTVKIEAKSEAQEATLAVGDSRRFDVTADGFYDVKVTLDSIASSKASLTVKSIHEEVTAETEAEEAGKEAEAKSKEEAAKKAELIEKAKKYSWIVIIIIAVIALIAFFVYKKKRK